MSADPGQDTAERVGRIIAAGDRLAHQFGVNLIEIRPGYARCAMTVGDHMANAAGVAHGGALFAFADIAFAHACNSHGRLALAMGVDISFLGRVDIGDHLIAEAEEISLRGRNGITDVRITDRDGTLVALFRGRSLQLDGPLGGWARAAY